MTRQQLQEQCELGQQQLMETNYLQAIDILAAAEQGAWDARDYDTLARLYMPLQEARRQARQRCGEGIIKLDLIASPDHSLDPSKILDQISHGQLLVAGWASIEPVVQLRREASRRKLYVETFLGAVYPAGGGNVITIVPLEDTALPPAQSRSPDELKRLLPPNSLILEISELPTGQKRGDSQTYGRIMAIWERLHLPFLKAADMQSEPIRRMEGYRATIRVDSACELAHQKLSDLAKQLGQ